MPKRHDFLISSAVAGAAALVRSMNPGLATASQPATPVSFEVPKGACDCHTHIFGDSRRFPFAESRTYTPVPASVDEMRALHRALHTDRVVIVQPSVYGTDNACTIDATRQLGSSARGVAVIDDKISESELDEMDRAGIRGIRLNLETEGQTDPAVARHFFQAAVERIKGRKWHLQLYTRLSLIEGISDQIMAAPAPVVLDHFGGAQGSLGIRQPGFETLLNLVRTGKVYVKVSAPYRISTEGPDYPDVAPLAKALIAANPHRILWGTDWPHTARSQVAGHKATDIAPLSQIDDGSVFNLLAIWAPDPVQRKNILVVNPANLYGF